MYYENYFSPILSNHIEFIFIYVFIAIYKSDSISVDRSLENVIKHNRKMSSETENVHLKDNTDLQIQKMIEKHEKKVETNGLEVPRKSHRLSFMEEESLKERNRLQLLKQIAAILKQGDERYSKETLHRTFQDDVSIILTVSGLH